MDILTHLCDIKLVSIHKCGFLFKIKACEKITTGICVIFRGLIFEHNAETCPPQAGWAKRPFMDRHY